MDQIDVNTETLTISSSSIGLKVVNNFPGGYHKLTKMVPDEGR
jgi:hypothetical protein